MKTSIIRKYLSFVKKEKRLPTYADFGRLGVTKNKIRHHFTNIESLHLTVSEEHTEKLHTIVAHEDYVFSKVKLKELSEDLKKYKMFFITTAVTQKEVDENFLSSIRHFCKVNEAKLLILPSADVHSTNAKVKWIFDPLLKEDTFIHTDVKVNDNIFLSSIKVIAKQINPTTGLSRIGQRNGSYIFASPKQFLEYIATGPSKNKVPHAIMTPGAVTKNEYSKVKYMNDRTAYIAESDHVMGGIILKIDDSKTFHFTQVQADSKGRFINRSVEYSPDGAFERVSSTLVLGDWHSGATDEKVIKTLPTLIKEFNAQDLIIHDMFDGSSISPHDLPHPLKMAMKDNISLLKELEQGAKDLDWLTGLVPGKIIVVKSNHDEWLERYLHDSNYIKDAQNHRICLDLSMKLLDGLNVLQYAYETYGGLKNKDRIIWLDRDQSYKIGDVELGAHGDIGANGSKGTLNSLEKAYGPCVVGHVHSPAILRYVWRVGTLTKMKLSYNRGPSSWVHTCCAVYPNGSRQLTNLMKGKWG